MTRTLTIQQSIVVKRPADAAFRAFVDEIGRWWPLQEGYTFGKGRAKEIILEGRVGGRLFERFTDGEEYVVGKVTAYQPPSRVVFTWQDHAWPGATEVEIGLRRRARAPAWISSTGDGSRSARWARSGRRATAEAGREFSRHTFVTPECHNRPAPRDILGWDRRRPYGHDRHEHDTRFARHGGQPAGGRSSVDRGKPGRPHRG